ncbi:hypothetical protein D9611_005029 [Ephemerocybe angulata]|uniref:Uncharacterized protein n=1 Tax=Ephemerocybe angulata TaxID=980116 RepID=A0A8H5EX99_9AGAR|nr:hypothetical protein D9611_005029 [Tulosesus angulatus]
MPDTPLSTKVMPRRGAAKRANAAWQDAVQDSSSDGDGDSERETSAAPSGRRAKPSIKKGHSTGNITTPAPGDPEKKKPSPRKTYSGALKRKRRQAAAAVDGEEDTSSDSGPSSSLKPVAKIPLPNLTKAKEGAKRERPKPSVVIPTLADDDDLSDLTPLSSPLDSIESMSAKEPTPPPPPRPKPFARPIQEHPMFMTAKPASKPRTQSLAGSKQPSWEAKADEEEQDHDAQGWRVEDLGKDVWVRLDGRNSKTARLHTDRSETGNSVWWPAFVTSKAGKLPLKVKLYGSHPRGITIEEPCPSNVLSKLDSNGAVRFTTFETASNYPERARANPGPSSPRKRQKMDDEHQASWSIAINNMYEPAGELSDDEPPPLLEILSVARTVGLRRTESTPNLKFSEPKNANKSPRKGKRKRPEKEEEPSDYELLEGEVLEDEEEAVDVDTIVVARDLNPRSTEYWPARVLEYYPPKRRREEGKYKLEYLDSTQLIVPRSYFYHDAEDGFVSVKMGKMQHAVVDDTVDKENDDDIPIVDRSPSPPCEDPPPDQDTFVRLSLREQFAYVKPVLQAILQNNYGPTKDKFQVFMSGTRAQQASLAQIASERGMMDPQQVSELLVYLKWWCLRGERQPQTVEEEEDADADAASAAGDAPESVATEPLPSVAPSSPALTEVALPSSPPLEPPMSSFSPLTELSVEQGGLSLVSGSADDDGDNMDTREDGVVDVLVPIEDEAPAPRQTGAPEYEAITPLQRLDFCLNILLQEAIRQILLWRKGSRTKAELLSPEEEERLHKEGGKLLNERDWVQDVLRLRKRLGADLPLPQKNQVVSSRGRATKKVTYKE